MLCYVVSWRVRTLLSSLAVYTGHTGPAGSAWDGFSLTGINYQGVFKYYISFLMTGEKIILVREPNLGWFMHEYKAIGIYSHYFLNIQTIL